MRFYEVSETINADADRVWEVLRDVGAYADWDSGVEKVEGGWRRARSSRSSPSSIPAAATR